MGGPGIKDPSVGPTFRTIRTLFHGNTVGVLGAAVTAHLSLRLFRSGRVPLPADKHIFGALGAAFLGYGIGYGSMSAVQWVRWRMIQMLLEYRDWMYYPKATSTKVSYALGLS